ncbi:MAG: hypothetical protein OEX81_04280 [Candidatus Pacebacteria bacterium]|nr:hypothetical protein [Candidatus Paceibacterota bacterium]
MKRKKTQSEKSWREIVIDDSLTDKEKAEKLLLKVQEKLGVVDEEWLAQAHESAYQSYLANNERIRLERIERRKEREAKGIFL